MRDLMFWASASLSLHLFAVWLMLHILNIPSKKYIIHECKLGLIVEFEVERVRETDIKTSKDVWRVWVGGLNEFIWKARAFIVLK